MDGDSIVKILWMAVFILFSAYFSATETAFSSLSKTRLKALRDRGNKRAALVLSLSEQYDNLLSTLLVGNNIVNIAIASLGTVLFVRRFGDDLGPSLSTAVVTVVVLFCGEVTPKSLAKEAPERVAMFSAPILRVFLIILKPVNFIFFQWKTLLARIFKVKDDRKLTQEELLLLVDEVEQEGGIDRQERELLRNAIEFNDLTAADILTPRISVEGLPLEATPQQARELFAETGFSRLPVYTETIDHIVGVLHQKDLYIAPEGTPIEKIMQTPLYVTETVKIDDLLRMLQASKSHMAVVAEERGGTLGIVTMEDILEELVGEIWDEHDEVEEPIRAVGEGTYAVMGQASAEKLFEELGLSEETEAATVGGWVMEHLGRIPSQGESFSFGGYRFTVEEMNYQQIIRLTVQAEQPSVQAAQPAE